MKSSVSAADVAPGAVSDTAAAVTVAPTLERASDASMSALELAMAELRRLLAAWRAHEPGARGGTDPEELHQLRVTVRRIDALLGLLKGELPQSLLRARRTAKSVLRSLGAARDLDVQLGELAQYCASLPEDERRNAEPLRARLEKERLRAHARMVRSLDSEPTRRWLETLTHAAADTNVSAGGELARAVLAERVRRRFRKLRKSVAKLRPRSSIEAYHRVRRRAKQLRYTMECGAAMFGKPGEELLKALRRLQDGLGAHQDAHMAQQRLAAIAADSGSGLPAGTLFLMGRLAEHHARRTAGMHGTLTRYWRKVRGRRWKALRARLAELTDKAGTADTAPTARELSDSGRRPVQVVAGRGTSRELRAASPELRSINH